MTFFYPDLIPKQESTIQHMMRFPASQPVPTTSTCLHKLIGFWAGFLVSLTAQAWLLRPKHSPPRGAAMNPESMQNKRCSELLVNTLSSCEGAGDTIMQLCKMETVMKLSVVNSLHAVCTTPHCRFTSMGPAKSHEQWLLILGTAALQTWGQLKFTSNGC
jgi:hypothetical protein